MGKRKKVVGDHYTDIRIAKELGYPAKTIDALYAEDDPNKRQQILIQARLNLKDK